MNPIDRSMDQATEIWGRFWYWWLAELREMMPRALQRYIPHPKGPIIWRPDPEGTSSLRDLDGRELPPKVRSQARTVIADLSALTYRYEVSFPPVARTKLHQAIALQLDRLVPWPPEDVFFDCKPLKEAPGQTGRMIEIAILRKSDLENLCTMANAEGLKVTRAGLLNPDRRFGLAFQFPLPREKSEIKRALNLTNGLKAAFAVLMIGLVWSIEDRRASEMDTIAISMERARQEAALVVSMHSELASVTSRESFLANLYAETRITDLLVELTDALPDDIWLSALRLEEARFSIEGAAPSVSAAREATQGRPLFTNVAVVSEAPVQGAPSSRVQFELAGETVPMQTNAAGDGGSDE